MRADISNADMAAFYLSAILLAVMIMTLLLLLTVVFKFTNQHKTGQSSTSPSGQRK
ncbi:hypothetical protein HDU81_001196, partial [Chytriomyces hyalinus]